MADEKTYVTQEGLEELQREHEHLIHVVRGEVIEDLKAARAQGDLSENADYDAARDRQAQVEARIAQVEAMLANYELISNDDKGVKVVKLGRTVTIVELDTNEECTYTIVGTVEADPLQNKLSNVTPLALAIMDQRVGAVCDVDAAVPYQVKIKAIK